MGSSVSNNVNIQNQITNNILQELVQTCAASCTANASGNHIIIGGNTGNVTITAQCSASASCAMTNNANAAVNNIISNLIAQETTTVTDFMGDLSFTDVTNNINISNSISNYITQISTQTCNAVSDATADDNFIYVQQGGTAGNLLISANGGNASASCAMTNTSKIQAYNQVQSNVSQTTTTVGMFAMIGIVIVVIILVGGIIFMMMHAEGATGKVVNGGGTGDPLDGLSTQQMNNLTKKLKLEKDNIIKNGVKSNVKSVSAGGVTVHAVKVLPKSIPPVLPPVLPPRKTTIVAVVPK